MTKRFDNIWLGLGLSIILTAIAFFGFYYINEDRFHTLSTFFNYITFTGMFSSVISLSALPNLILFFLFIWTRRYRSARGVLTAVMLITLLVAFLRLS
ncbi:MAG: hypothetical protein PF489_15465 [Salinivirgaceae bacterium]|jgi:hypothetical protein|nr:hypothetical protein [Salinivirgaceae bacterium]